MVPDTLAVINYNGRGLGATAKFTVSGLVGDPSDV